MRAPLFLFAIFACAPAFLFSQQSDQPVIPEARLLFAPLIAHHIEPRVGLSRLINEERLRLDIGNSIDLLRRRDLPGDAQLAVGADFFTWTSLRQKRDFHFPVDAVDYLFGVNTSYMRPLSTEWVSSLRFRLSHISAHLVDGSYDKENAQWRDNRLPIVYSREFLELIAAFEWRGTLRLYGGGTWIYHIDPAWLGKWSMQGGAEGVWREAGWSWLHAYAAMDLRLVDISGWHAAVNVELGVKAGRWRGTGVQLFIAWFHGKSQHGEYFNQTWSYWGPGFNIDF